ncbi:acyltransferase family protein [Paenibacillus sp. strain BS8-2]
MMRRFYPGITMFKLAGAILVLAAHALLIPSMTAMNLPPLLSFLMLEGRIVVPCFYLVSGFLLYKGWTHADKPVAYVRKYILRITAVYAVFCLLFAFEFVVPALANGGFGISNLLLQGKIMFMAVFVNGPLIQLWFIPPLLFGAVASYWLLNRLGTRGIVVIVASSYLLIQLVSGSLLGLFGIGGASIDSAVTASDTPLEYAIMWATRYLGFGLTFVVMGAWIARYEEWFLRLDIRKLMIGAAALTVVELLLLLTFAPWTEAYKLTFSMIPNTALLFYGVLKLRSAIITAHHRLLNLFSIVAFVAHIPLMRLNAWMLGWGGSMELELWQQVLQTGLTFVECVIVTTLLHRRKHAGRTGATSLTLSESQRSPG